MTISRLAPIAVLFTALALSSLRLWQFDYPPLVDWPNHLARHAIQCGDAEWGRLGAYYNFDLRLVPNLTADLIYALPVACYDILLTQKILIQFAILGLILSAFALHYAIWRQLSVWPGLASLVALNMNFGYGFENFILAAPLAIALLALWVALDRTQNWLRFVIIAPLAAFLYVCHLYAFVFFGAVLGAIELQRAWANWRAGSSKTNAVLVRLGGAALVGIWPAYHALSNMAGGDSLNIAATAYGGLISRLTALLSLSTYQSFFLLEGVSRLDALFALLVLGLAPLVLRRLGGKFSFDCRFIWAAIACGLLYLLTPAILASVHFTDIRFPLMGAVVLIAASNMRLNRRLEAGLVVVLALSFALRSEITAQRWVEHDAQVQELLAAGEIFTPDDTLLVARFGVNELIIRHSHTMSYISMRSGAFLPTLFNGANPLLPKPNLQVRTTRSAFPVDYRRLFADMGSDGPESTWTYLGNWQQNYTHIVILHRPEDSLEDVTAFGERVHRGSFFDIYALP